MSLTAHVLVKNEEIYIKQSILSVYPYVDKILIFDTGSTDKTISIIKELINSDKQKKIALEERGLVDSRKHTVLRNEMIEKTTTDWFMILDGDEVWPDDQIEFVIKKDIPAAEKIGRNCIMVSYHLCSVDLFHYTERGHFGTPWGLHGHFTYRFFRKINDIRWRGDYGKDDLVYKDGKRAGDQDNLLFSTTFFWHLSKLKRSSKDLSVMFRKKPTKAKFVPLFIRKKFLLKYGGDIPKILLNNDENK